MAERFAKVVSKKSGSYLTTQHQKYRVCLYNKTIMPFALVVYELIYTTRAHGLIVSLFVSKISHFRLRNGFSFYLKYGLKLFGKHFLSKLPLYITSQRLVPSPDCNDTRIKMYLNIHISFIFIFIYSSFSFSSSSLSLYYVKLHGLISQ